MSKPWHPVAEVIALVVAAPLLLAIALLALIAWLLADGLLWVRRVVGRRKWGAG